ncbi:MAG: hypothetical protein HS115_09235 [Spirochaetales bacterium]|nr:hypothetical protein [Spirochaetales bacterium]
MRALGLFFLLLSVVSAQEIPRFRIKEEQARSLFVRGLAFYNNRQYIASREFFYKALDVQPYFHLARRYLGDAYYYSGDWNAALEQWELLDEFSAGAYPLVRQRSELLRFALSSNARPGPYTLLSLLQTDQLRGASCHGPTDLALDQENALYLACFDSGRIVKFNSEAEYLTDFSGPFWDPLQTPLGLAYRHDRLYVSDFKADRLRVFDGRGRSVMAFGERGSGKGQFYGPAGVALAEDGVYVADTGNHRIIKFSEEGRPLSVIPIPDEEEPGGLAVGAQGELFVSLPEADQVLVYDLDGNLMRTIEDPTMRRPMHLHRDGTRLLISNQDGDLLFYDTLTSTFRSLAELRDNEDRRLLLRRLHAARSSGMDALYLADYAANRLLLLVPEAFRISNFDIRIQNIDSRAYPSMAVFLTLAQRTGKPLLGLERKNFRIYENDNRLGGIRIDNIKPYNHRVNLVLVQENSEIMRERYQEYLSPLAMTLLKDIRISDRLTVVRAGEQVRTVYQATQEADLKRREIARILTEGEVTQTVNLGKAIFDALAGLLDALGPRRVTLITSGAYHPVAFRQYSLQRIVQFARAHQIKVDVISYQGEDDPEKSSLVRSEWLDLTSMTGGSYISAFDESRLKDYFIDLTKDKDQRYIITYRTRSEQVLRGRYVDVRVEVDYAGSSGLADGGYFIPE